MSTMTRSMTSGEVEMLREQRARLKRGVRKCIERMSMPACACLGAGLGLGVALRHGDAGAWTVPIIALSMLPVALFLGAAWHWREFNERRKPVRECDATLQRGQVIEERFVALRAAEVNHILAGTPGLGPIETADCFYDLGDGRVVYVSELWRHTDDNPHHARRELKLVYTAGHKMPLTVITQGEPLEVIHAQTEQPIDLPNGTILPGGLDAVLAAIGAKMKVHPEV